ncbi:unnamed protein product [Prorocentrum cordatum]|uniref:Armadillo repeat-containing protein 1 n=1 Tax=Prorocentrum cordatum TaxID=2364126 RepID=A0ABN9RR35_9DINO|nr:unnamed protein product [Polarella glacialis]
MAADQALGVVRQIQALAEGPQTPQMRALLGQVVPSLLAFLDHPDSRVRLNSARALRNLSAGYPEDVAALDLGRARGALGRVRESRATGAADGDAEELEGILAEVLEASLPWGASATSTAASTPPPGCAHRPTWPALSDAGDEACPPPPAASAASSSWRPRAAPAAPGGAVGRGEVVLKVGEHADGKVKATILEHVVAISGVVSVTFEGDFVIVSARSAAVAADAAFLADVLAAMRAQGIEGVSLVSAGGAGASGGPGPGEPAPAAASSARAVPARHQVEIFDVSTPELRGGRGYLDDEGDEDEVVLSGSCGDAVLLGAPAGPAGALVGGHSGRSSRSPTG